MLQLLRLLLVALLHLLLSSLVGILLNQPLVLLLLLLLEFLSLLFLLRITRTWRSRTLHWRQLAGMHRVSATRGVVSGRSIAWPCIASSRVSWTPMNGTGLSGGHNSAIIKCCRPGSGRDRRLATVHRRA